jgi:hypothetical protein
MPSRDAPDNVDRVPWSIPLEDENTGTFGVGRIVFDHDRRLNTVDHLTRKDTVLGDLVVAGRGDPKRAGEDQMDDPYERLAHLVVSSVTSSLSRANWNSAPG